MSVRMIVLLGIFVWAPMMAFLAWKFAQTYTTASQGRSSKRRARRALLLANDGHAIHNEERRRLVRRSF